MMGNTMMMNNPMMAMMMGGMAGMMNAGMPMAGMQPTSSTEAVGPVKDGKLPVDTQIRDLCRTFNIEERLMRKLDLVMQRRPESFDDDIQTLRDRLSQPRADIGVLITQLEKGFFMSAGSMPRAMVALVKKYNLDDRASQRLAESLMKREETMKEDLKDLDIRLASADRPSGLLMTLLQNLDTTGELPPAPRSLGLPGGYQRDRDRRREARPERRSRSRSRSRRRKSRSRSRKRR